MKKRICSLLLTLALVLALVPATALAEENASIAPTAAGYDKATASAGVSFTLTPGSYTLDSIYNSREMLAVGTDYTVSGNVYTITQGYLNRQAPGAERAVVRLEFRMSGGTNPTAEISITDSNPDNAALTPTAISYNKRAASAGLTFTLTHGGNNRLYDVGRPVAGSVLGTSLARGTDYTVRENANSSVCVISKSYLDAQPNGTVTLWFTMNRGAMLSAVITITEEEPPRQPGGYTADPTVTLYNDPNEAKATVWLCGSGLSETDRLVTERNPAGSEYKALKLLAGANDVFATYNIYLASGAKGTGAPMYLSFDLSERYAGQTFTLVHQKADGTAETFTAMADARGDLAFGPLFELSPFMLVKGTLGANTLGVPDTGAASFPALPLLLCALLGAGMALARKRRCK